MSSSSPQLADLNDLERLKVQAFVTELEHSWNEGKLAELSRRLPAAGNPIRHVALVQLIQCDLRRQWQRGHKPTVESYLERYPELGPAESVPVELIQTEYDLRVELGPPITWAELAQRFPRQIQALEQSRSAAESQSSPEKTEEQTAVVSPPSPPLAATLPPPPAQPGQPGEDFGRYKLVRMLGQGGMGSVYLAHDTQLKRPVALKVPHFSAHNAPRVLTRFQREAQAAATLVHPNICPVYDVGAINGIHYLTMAFIEGKPLSAHVRKDQTYPQRQAAERVFKLALALEEAHVKGVVHRDLKPSNIMINQRDEPVIMDFGLAHLTSEGDESRITQFGVPLGTPSYMAPEQVEGEADAAGPPCDIYSLGVILYELLTGRVPFIGTAGHVMAKVLKEEPPLPSSLRKELDPRLEKICLKAMAKSPADRFTSMSAFAAALAEYLQDDAGTAGIRPLVKPIAASAPLPSQNLRAPLPGELPDTAGDASRTPFPSTLEWNVKEDASGERNGKESPLPRWLLAATVLLVISLAATAAVVYFNQGPLKKQHQQTDSGDSTQPKGDANRTGTVELKLADPTLPLDVHIDGKPITGGDKPIELSAGRHQLRVSGADIEPIERSFEVQPGGAITLPLAPTVLGTVPYPVGDAELRAKVEVDGKEMPAAKPLRLPVGPHQLRITGPDIDPIEQRISVQRGPNAALDIKPMRYGEITLALADSDAEITIDVDRKPVPRKSLDAALRLPVGKHHLSVRGPDIDAIERDFTVEPGKNPPLSIQPEVFGSITLSWKEPGYAFQLDGKTLKPPAEPLRLPVGKHKIKIVGADIDPLEQDFVVRRGKNEPLAPKPVFYGAIKLDLSDPKADVEMRIDGQQVAKSKHAEPLRLAVGEHDIKVSGQGYKTVSSTVRIERGSNPPYKIRLERRDPFASGDKHIRNSLDMALVRIGAGKFVMGSPRTEEGRLDDEQQHSIAVTRPFYMGVHEVRVGEFRTFVKDARHRTEAERTGGGWKFDLQRGEFEQDPKLTWNTPGWNQEDDFPVVCVTYQDAKAFCDWLSKKEGKTYRLPTEAEWEYACRADTKTPFAFGDTLSADQANFNGKYPYGDAKELPALGRAAKTGTYKANAFGLHDMHGNVWEWCADFYKDYDTGDESPKAKGKRVLRGGSWVDRAIRCRSAYRSYEDPRRGYPYVGFRVVVEISD